MFLFMSVFFMVFLLCVITRTARASVITEEVDPLEKFPWQKAKVDNVEFVYKDIGRKDAPAIVFVHGFGCDSSIWKEQVKSFSKEYRLLIPDLPGYGESEKPQDQSYTMDFFAKAVKVMVDKAGVRQPVLVGHSMGFSVLRRYLIRYPDRARAICNVDGFFFRSVTQAAMFNWWKSMIDFLRWPMFTPEAQICFSAVEIIEFSFYGKTPEPLREQIRSAVLKNDPYVLLSSWESMLSCMEWIPMQSGLPALILYSSAIHMFPDAKVWFQTDFPHLDYIEWDDTGHYMMLEQPERFNELLKNFLQDHNIA